MSNQPHSEDHETIRVVVATTMRWSGAASG